MPSNKESRFPAALLKPSYALPQLSCFEPAQTESRLNRVTLVPPAGLGPCWIFSPRAGIPIVFLPFLPRLYRAAD